MPSYDSRLDGRSALALAAFESEIRFKSEQRPVDEARAHLDDIYKSFGDVEHASWKIAFGDMFGWALTQAAKDQESLTAAGQPDPNYEGWRRRVLAHGSRTDILLKFSAWKALLANPDQVPTASELSAAKGKDPAAYDALTHRLWAAAQIQNPLAMAGVYEFDRLTKDIRQGPGLFETNFRSKTGKMLLERIAEGMKVAGEFVHAGEAVWKAMEAQQRTWSEATREAERRASADTGAKPYGGAPSGHASTSSTGGTPSLVAIRAAKD